MAEVNKIKTNDCTVGETAVVKGTLGDFTFYLTRPLMGEKLKERIAKDRARGSKYPNTHPRFEVTLNDPEIVLAGATPTNTEKYLHQGFYRVKSGDNAGQERFGVVCNTSPEKIRLPLFKLKSTGEKLSLANKSLAPGQVVYVHYEVTATEKGNNGIFVKLIEFEEAPKFAENSFDVGELYTAPSSSESQAAPQEQDFAPADTDSTPFDAAPVQESAPAESPASDSFWQ